MKQYCFLFIFIILFLHTGCVKKTSTVKQSTEAEIQAVSDNTEGKAETDTIIIPDNEADEKREFLYIGGKKYWGSWDEEKVYLRVDPEDPEHSNSLENIELHRNLKKLTIEGKNLDKVDFSPISLLTKLEILIINGNITRMPDMTNLKQLREVEIKGAALKSLEGINGSNIEDLLIESHGSSENTMLKVSDMKNLVNLNNFAFDRGKIDVGGIDRFSSLEILTLRECEPYNINSIGNLKKLKILDINLVSENPSLEFLKNMQNLEIALFFGNFHLYDYSWDYDYKPTHVLDVAPLATSKKLRRIIIKNFVIKNISALDVLDINYYIYLVGSRLYDEKEKSKHYLKFYEVDG